MSTVHAYTPRAVRQAIEAGVKCIDHGQLLDEPTVALMAEKGVWWSLQPFLDDEPLAVSADGSPNRIKQLADVRPAPTTPMRWRRSTRSRPRGAPTRCSSAEAAAKQGAHLTKLTAWYTPAEVLKMATSGNAELLALSGLRSPYAGKLGVVQEGALADLLLVDGDPLANIKLIEDPAKNFVVIMKDGKIYKNTLRP